MGMGANSLNGRIDNESVPRLLHENGKNGNKVVGIKDSAGRVFGEGQYPNQVVYNNFSGRFHYWDGSSKTWADFDGQNMNFAAAELFRSNYKSRTGTDSEGFNVAYKTAVEDIGYNSLRYPADVSTDSNSDFVLFDFFDYQPPFKDNQQFYAQLPDSLKAARQNGNIQKFSDRRFYTNELLSQYLRTGQSNALYKRDTSGRFPQIMLYMPDDISDTLKADWQGKAFGSTTAGLLSASAADGNIEKIKSLSNLTGGTIKRAPVELAASLVTNLAKGITGDTINTGDIFGGISGAIRNPNVEVLFQKMNLRTFDLTFKLVPYDIDESNKIKKIIKVFKKSMLPTYSIGDTKVLDTKGSENAAVEASFIKVPKVCKVTYMRGSKQHPDLPTYKMCAITDIGINYTPDGNYAVYKDGSPVAYELKINFMETKLLFSEEIDTGEDMSDSYAVKRWEYGDSD